MVTFSLGTNSKRAANGSTDHRIVMQMAPKRATQRHRAQPALQRHARSGKLCHSALLGAEFHQWESHVSSAERKQVKGLREGRRWGGRAAACPAPHLALQEPHTAWMQWHGTMSARGNGPRGLGCAWCSVNMMAMSC